MSDTESRAPRGFSRRTALQAAAWSVPVIAASVATPHAAASPFVDIVLTALAPSDAITATSPDGLRAYTLPLPSAFNVANVNDSADAGGSIIVSFDSRLLGAVTITTPGVQTHLSREIVTGNLTSVWFSIDHHYTRFVIVPTFGILNRGLWFEDVLPYSVRITSGWDTDDPDLSNNIATSMAEYTDVPSG